MIVGTYTSSLLEKPNQLENWEIYNQTRAQPIPISLYVSIHIRTINILPLNRSFTTFLFIHDSMQMVLDRSDTEWDRKTASNAST